MLLVGTPSVLLLTGQRASPITGLCWITHLETRGEACCFKLDWHQLVTEPVYWSTLLTPRRQERDRLLVGKQSLSEITLLISWAATKLSGERHGSWLGIVGGEEGVCVLGGGGGAEWNKHLLRWMTLPSVSSGIVWSGEGTCVVIRWNWDQSASSFYIGLKNDNKRGQKGWG